MYYLYIFIINTYVLFIHIYYYAEVGQSQKTHAENTHNY